MSDPPATIEGRTADGRFALGSGGKPKGTRHKATRAIEAMLDGESAQLTRKAIDLALAGDPTALRIVFERLCPPRRDRPIQFALPPISAAADHPPALAAVARAVAEGELTPMEGTAFAAILEQHRRSIETCEIMARLEALEGKGGDA